MGVTCISQYFEHEQLRKTTYDTVQHWLVSFWKNVGGKVGDMEVCLSQKYPDQPDQQPLEVLEVTSPYKTAPRYPEGSPEQTRRLDIQFHQSGMIRSQSH